MADLKRTVETALDRASGWLFGKYSSFKKDHTIYINIQYPEVNSELGKKTYDLSRPNLISIRRYGKNSADVLFSKDVFIDKSDKQKKASYRLSIKKDGGTFQAIETPDAEVITQGDAYLLADLMQDPDFGHYLTIVPQGISKNTRFPKWNLNKMMERSRPSIGD